jgi:hypothetical protein
MIAVFPLNIVVLPGESVALHLFEPRYKQLFNDFKAGGEFAIVYQGTQGLSSYGTLVSIDKIVNEFPDGTADIIVKGCSVINVQLFHAQYPGKLYSGISALKLKVSGAASSKLLALFRAYLKSQGKSVKSKGPHVFYIANRLNLSQEVKDRLIRQGSDEAMNRFLINELLFLQKLREQEQALQRKFHLN